MHTGQTRNPESDNHGNTPEPGYVPQFRSPSAGTVSSVSNRMSSRAGKRLWWPLALVLLALTVATACSSSDPAPVTGAAFQPVPDTTTVVKHASASVLITSGGQDLPAIRTVEIVPETIVLDKGESVPLSARAFGPDGEPLADVDFVWAVSDPRAGDIQRGGEFEAGNTPGVFSHAVSVTGVQNTVDGIQYAIGSAGVTVIGEPTVSRLKSVVILPSDPTVSAGQIFRLWAVAFDQNGLVIPGVSLTWEVNDPSLGRVNDIGYLTVEGDEGRFADAATVTARWEDIEISATTDVVVLSTRNADDFINVQVLPQRFFLEPGDRLRLRAFALNGLGELMTGTQLRWSMERPGAGIIDGNGMFVGGDTPGVFTEAVRVEAIVPGESGFIRAEDFASVVIQVEQSARHLESVKVLPRSVIVGPGGRTLLLAQPVDRYGSPAEDVSISWEAVQADVGEIDENGSFTATGRPGTYPGALNVRAEQTADGEVITKTAAVDVVITGTLTALEVRPALATISPGKTVHFSLTGRDENGFNLTGLVALWSVSDERIGTIDAFGNFTAGDVAGHYQDAIQVEVKQTIPVSR